VIFDIQADSTQSDVVKVPAALVIQEGPRQGERLNLFAGPNIIGREAGNRIVLDDEMISRRHASLYPASGAYYIKDLNSTHGTWVNNLRIHDEQMLKDGDLIRLGSTTLRLRLGEQPAGGTAPVPAALPAAAQPAARLAPAALPASRPVSAPAQPTAAAKPTPKPASPSIFSRRLLGIPYWIMSLGLLPVLAVCLVGAFVIVPKLLPVTPTPTTPIRREPTTTALPTDTPSPFLPIDTPTPGPAGIPTWIDDFGVTMVLVEGGSFQMGNKYTQPLDICMQYNPIQDFCIPDPYLNAEPPHTVYLDPYLIDMFEVSNAQYRECLNAGYCSGPIIYGTNEIPDYFTNPAYDNYPVIGVDWDRAATYCAWRGARLPTEAEWEMAARGTDGRMFPWGDTYDPLLVNGCDDDCSSVWAMPNYDDGYSEAAPVNAFSGGVSPYGIYNMAGNVTELVADFYDAAYYSTLGDGVWNPLGPPTGEYHVMRGGSWSYPTDMLTTGARFYIDTVNAFPDTGFRCAHNP